MHTGQPATIKHAVVAHDSSNPAIQARQKRIEIQRFKSRYSMNYDAFHSSDRGYQSSSGTNGRMFVCGHVSVMGRRREMEDMVTVAPTGWLSGDYGLFAVYDGHGGATVAETCNERLPMCLEKCIQKQKLVEPVEDGIFDWGKVMADCFREIDGVILDKVADRKMGSTALVVLVGNEEVVVANCGDSRAVLCRGGAVVPLSDDHKPDRPDEKERIEAAGGRIVNHDGWRVQGVLPTSRSLGDHYLKPWVTCEPEVTVMSLAESDSFLIIATDGLWDVVSNEMACQIVQRSLSGQLRTNSLEGSHASDAATTLAELAIAKGSKDNISIIVVQLK